MGLPISVLDQSPALVGVTEDVSIRQTVEMAQHCERLGYNRFWVSEHHGSQSIVGSAPEILITAIAVQTQRIRVGSAGVMLPHYAPLKVAEQFCVIESLAPGRIDLGLGRAPGGDGRMSHALNPLGDQAVERFPANVRDIVAWTSGRPLPDNHPYGSIRVSPHPPTAPEVFVLGSSDYGAQVAAYLGLPFCFASFISERGAEQAFEIYRRYYQPSERHPKPHANACVFALAADTNERAREVFATRAKARLNRDRGIRMPLVPWQEALAEPRSVAEQIRFDGLAESAIIGDGPTCAGKLRAFAQSLDLDELTILTHAYDIADRKRSFEVLAGAFALGA